MAALRLYRQQEAGVERFDRQLLHTNGPRRLVLGWATGCGKTAGALSILERRYCPRRDHVLVVTPAIVRRHWLREMERWAPSWAAAAAPIEWGRRRKLPASKAADRDDAYLSPCQVVSYDLLRHVEATGWDLVILDELHHIATPTAKQSKLVAKLVAANPTVDILGLTATPFPTEVQQIWNPMRLLFGERAWGKPSRTGTVSWEFARRYCHLDKNEYGTAIRGSLPETRAELRGKLEKHCHFLTRSDLRSDLPDLNVNLLELDAASEEEAIVEWCRAKLAEGVQRIVVLTHFRATARAVFQALQSSGSSGPCLRYIDGATTPAWRDDVLQYCEAASGAPVVLVGTHGALAEGVRLMWAEEVLVCQWPMSPGRMVQILGRFQSVGSADLSPHVSLATRTDTWGASQTLLERVQAMLEITGPSPTGEKIQRLIADNKLAADDMACLMDDMLSGMKSEGWLDNLTGDDK